MTASPARQAREAAGFTLEAAARCANLKPETLAAYERTGRFGWATAQRLARVYGARIESFLPPPGRQRKPGSRVGGGDCRPSPRGQAQQRGVRL
ncbi:MAG: helix-turn-helix transcriptional regulator [Armatimonadota bacterium]